MRILRLLNRPQAFRVFAGRCPEKPLVLTDELSPPTSINLNSPAQTEVPKLRQDRQG